MTIEREYWTVGTRDLRNILGLEFATHEAAKSYREWASLGQWVIVSVTETEDGREFMCPEMPDGPISMPAAGTF